MFVSWGLEVFQDRLVFKMAQALQAEFLDLP
jgi:hypothetical protein